MSNRNQAPVTERLVECALEAKSLYDHLRAIETRLRQLTADGASVPQDVQLAEIRALLDEQWWSPPLKSIEQLAYYKFAAAKIDNVRKYMRQRRGTLPSNNEEGTVNTIMRAPANRLSEDEVAALVDKTLAEDRERLMPPRPVPKEPGKASGESPEVENNAPSAEELNAAPEIEL